MYTTFYTPKYTFQFLSNLPLLCQRLFKLVFSFAADKKTSERFFPNIATYNKLHLI